MSLTRDTSNNYGEIHSSQGLDWELPSRPIIILSEPYLSIFCLSAFTAQFFLQ